MTQINTPSVFLFSYGTLQQKAVQLANFGRELGGKPDAMPGYEQAWLEIKDPTVIAQSGKTHHPVVRPCADRSNEIPGMVFEITPDELAAADRYEVSDYKRILVKLKSGIDAWVYVGA